MTARIYDNITWTPPTTGLRCLHCPQPVAVTAVALIGNIRLPVHYCTDHAETMDVPQPKNQP